MPEYFLVQKLPYRYRWRCIFGGAFYPLYPPVDLHWFFEISISAFISNWDKNSVIK
jgi:hypothetical protein